MRVWPGNPHPLGATWDGGGVDFALFSANATRVELCLFDGPEAPPSRPVWSCASAPTRSSTLPLARVLVGERHLFEGRRPRPLEERHGRG
jgi:pullulanase/glycogen debranching enzyme